MTGAGKEPEPEPQGLVEVIAEFPECVWCGSTRRMMGELGEEMRKQGMLTEGLGAGLAEVGGPIIDPLLADKILVNSIRPGMFALRDICIGCGREITVKIEKKPTMITMGMIAGQGLPGQSGSN